MGRCFIAAIWHFTPAAVKINKFKDPLELRNILVYRLIVVSSDYAYETLPSPVQTLLPVCPS